MSNEMEPFVTVVDNRYSALALVAKQRSELLASEICYASDFKNSNDLLEYLLASSKTKILFAWRGALREAIVSASGRRRYRRLLEIKTVHMLVPDLLGTTPNFLISEQRLVNITHGYWVTSQELGNIYTDLFPTRIPSGVLHDIPDISLILGIRALQLKKSGLIWVGNSKWGSNYGYVDHKGYYEVIEPLTRRDLPTHPFRIKDSSIARVPNHEVVREIAESEMLIQASAHEGTGLPILEALGVGTVPITSDVGIAREVLTGELRSLIVERSLESFDHKIRRVAPSVNSLSEICISAFDRFIDKIKNERIRWDRREIYFETQKTNILATCRVHMIWLYRFYRSKWKT
jgi:hypothetical protein